MFMQANHRARSGPRAREWGACAIALRFGITRDDENLSRKDRTNFVPKGLKDSAWGFNPRCLLTGPPRPHKALRVRRSCSCSCSCSCSNVVAWRKGVSTLLEAPSRNCTRVAGWDAEGAAEPVPQVCKDLPNEPLTTNIFHPFRAGRYVDRFLGLKPQAESLSPFGTNSDRIAIRAAKMQHSLTSLLHRSASHNSRTSTSTIPMRLVRAGRYVNFFPGLKTRAKSLSSFGTNS